MMDPSDNDDDVEHDYHSDNDVPSDSSDTPNNSDNHHDNLIPNNSASFNSHLNTVVKKMDKEKNSSDDDSDLDDPNYLKQMCSSFTAKVKEKNETINQYKTMLINSNLQLVKMQSAYQRKLRTLYLKGIQDNRVKNEKSEENQGQGMGRDPLALFPEEVWLMILSQISDVKDLQSLSRTCVLFEKILNSTKQQWLFGKVFPYLFNHLRRKDVLRSRLCCKQWSLSIDKFLEEYYLIQTYSSSKFSPLESTEKNLEEPDLNLKAFHFEYCYSIPYPSPEDLHSSDSDDDAHSPSSSSETSSQQSINRNHDKFREAMRLHERNPFIGRSVTIEEDAAVEEGFGIQNPMDRWRRQQRGFSTQAKTFLEDFGKHIWHLSMGCNMGLQGPQDFYRVINQSLENCGNLKSLCVSGNLDWSLGGVGGRAVDNEGDLKNCGSLESVQIDVDDRRVFWIQDKIVRKFSGQLKRLEVTLWQNDLYVGLDWGKLTELQVNKGISVLLLEGLKKTRMENLRKLTISLNGRGPYLRSLVELSKWFGKLNYLEVKLESRGIGEGCLEEELEEGVMASRELTTVEVMASVTEMKSYGWLVKFPWVSRVIIRHGHWTSFDGEGEYMEMVEGGGARVRKQREGKYRKDGVMRIAKYLGGDKVGTELAGKIYGRSGIWDCLPFLEELEVYNGRHVPARKKIFTREGYEYFKRSKEGDKGRNEGED